MAVQPLIPQPVTYGGMFIDFENIYYTIKNTYLDGQDSHDYAVDLISKLRDMLSRDLGVETLVLQAYADFDQVPTGPMGSLYLLGISTHNVLGTQHKNAADMQLCIDAMEMMHTRPDISTIVLVAGDRDYIPLLQRFRKQGKNIKVVSFRESVSGDLIKMLGAQHFIDARDVLGKAKMEELEAIKKNRIMRNIAAKKVTVLAASGVSHVAAAITATAPRSMMDQILQPEEPVEFKAVKRVTGPLERKCLSAVLEQMMRFRVNELWAGPFFKHLINALPELADYDRRQLVNGLIANGAVKMEKRAGEPHDYSVVIANYDHPDVRELTPAAEAV